MVPFYAALASEPAANAPTQFARPVLLLSEVQIKEVIGDHAHVLELRVAKDDLGKVIGKHGAHASAIRAIMAAASGKEKKRGRKGIKKRKG